MREEARKFSKNSRERHISKCSYSSGWRKNGKERKKKLKELLIQTFKENHQVGIVTSLYSAFCECKWQRAPSEMWQCNTEAQRTFIANTRHSTPIALVLQLTQYIREHFDLLFRSYSYILCVILRNWGVCMHLWCLSKLPFGAVCKY